MATVSPCAPVVNGTVGASPSPDRQAKADGLFELARRILRPRHRPQRITLVHDHLFEADARWLASELAVRAVEYQPGRWAVITGLAADVDRTEQQCRTEVARLSSSESAAAAAKGGAV